MMKMETQTVLKPLRIYVAGLLSRNHKGEKAFAIEYLENIAVNGGYAVKIMHKGHYPFCPGIDYSFFIINKAMGLDKISEKAIKGYSMEWLKVSDAIFMTPGWEHSPGSKAELEEAMKLGLKIFWSLDEIPTLVTYEA